MLQNMAGVEEHEALVRWQERFDLLSRALAVEGIVWQEPALDEPSHLRFISFPTSHLHHLRRVFALAARGESVTPASATSAEQYERDEDKVFDESTIMSSHLLCHSDSAGFYVPVDFDDPLFLPAEKQVEGGGMVGSSQQLLAELCGFASAIGVRLDRDRHLSDEESARLDTASDDLFHTERSAWHQLYQVCRTSIATGRAVVFH
ncbi:hypothetical protein [Streptomyces sp. R33]|uniref:DUF1877 family protein n=1 Tax=Streptomyces sp. R33 TaxID=3238629 RepID=A0AB39XV55_9ACTN